MAAGASVHTPLMQAATEGHGTVHSHSLEQSQCLSRGLSVLYGSVYASQHCREGRHSAEPHCLPRGACRC